MGVIDMARKMRDEIIINMSKVSREHNESEENSIRERLNAELNFDREDRFSKNNNKEKGQVDSISVRDISNGDDKYSVKDLLYSYHYDGRTDAWQYGIRVEDKDVSVREFSVTKDGETTSFVLKKEAGNYQEHGDSNDSGDFDYGVAKFSEFKDKHINIPSDLDLSNTNAIRYHFRNNKFISHFLDKYVIVTSDERKSYKEYAKEQDKLFALQKSKQDKLFGKVNE
ncbi:MAG: hypothetical protein IJ218_06195 [Alphaproteobacteria bacterium]|nr:hypothetical protein [Alphaproteobacteria bacterium]